eukprot:tig00021518_g22044.t1
MKLEARKRAAWKAEKQRRLREAEEAQGAAARAQREIEKQTLANKAAAERLRALPAPPARQPALVFLTPRAGCLAGLGLFEEALREADSELGPRLAARPAGPDAAAMAAEVAQRRAQAAEGIARRAREAAEAAARKAEEAAAREAAREAQAAAVAALGANKAPEQASAGDDLADRVAAELNWAPPRDPKAEPAAEPLVCCEADCGKAIRPSEEFVEVLCSRDCRAAAMHKSCWNRFKRDRGRRVAGVPCPAAGCGGAVEDSEVRRPGEPRRRHRPRPAAPPPREPEPEPAGGAPAPAPPPPPPPAERPVPRALAMPAPPAEPRGGAAAARVPQVQPLQGTCELCNKQFNSAAQLAQPPVFTEPAPAATRPTRPHLQPGGPTRPYLPPGGPRPPSPVPPARRPDICPTASPNSSSAAGAAVASSGAPRPTGLLVSSAGPTLPSPAPFPPPPAPAPRPADPAPAAPPLATQPAPPAAPPPVPPPASPSAPPAPPLAPEEEEEEGEEGYDSSDEPEGYDVRECSVCLSKVATVRFEPCGHQRACLGCVRTMRGTYFKDFGAHCPWCRAPVAGEEEYHAPERCVRCRALRRPAPRDAQVLFLPCGHWDHCLRCVCELARAAAAAQPHCPAAGCGAPARWHGPRHGPEAASQRRALAAAAAGGGAPEAGGLERRSCCTAALLYMFDFRTLFFHYGPPPPGFPSAAAKGPSPGAPSSSAVAKGPPPGAPPSKPAAAAAVPPPAKAAAKKEEERETLSFLDTSDFEEEDTDFDITHDHLAGAGL